MEPEKEVKEGAENAVERLDGLEKELAAKTLALREADARIAGMETEAKERSGEIAALKSENVTAKSDATTVRSALTEAVKSYREVILTANPELPPELIGGETVPALNEAVTKAKGMVGRVRQIIEAESARRRIPAGAPVRLSPGIEGLSAREKIQRGIGRE